MHLTKILFALASIIPSALTHSRPKPPTVQCDPSARGPKLEERQQAALADFTLHYAVTHDVQTAFDRWVPGQYIQHLPGAEQGREYAIAFLKDVYLDPAITTTNVRHFAGGGYGAIQFKLTTPAGVSAVVSHFRFEGTCIVEHWGVLQEISPSDTNPIAGF